jgi:hypothetical protein
MNFPHASGSLYANKNEVFPYAEKTILKRQQKPWQARPYGGLVKAEFAFCDK